MDERGILIDSKKIDQNTKLSVNTRLVHSKKLEAERSGQDYMRGDNKAR